MKVAAILPVLTILAGTVRAQTPSAKPGSIEGTVTNSVTGEPIKKATVTLGWVELSAIEPATAMTDATGHFQFEKVEPGSYVISAGRDGFMAARNRQNGLSSPIKVAADQHLQDVAIPLLPLATVSGHVLDEDGEPIVRAQVTVQRYLYGPYRRQLVAEAAAQSNDLGEFQALNLAPGRYYFQVTVSPPRNIPPRTRWTHPEKTYSVVFYPNASEAAQATATNVAPGAQMTNIDFRLRKVPAYHIRGRVSDTTTRQPQEEGDVAVSIPGNLGTIVSESRLQPDGTFDLRGVVNGSYEVTSNRYTAGKVPSLSQQEVRVSDADVNGLVLAPKPFVDVSGTVTVEGQQPDKLDLQIMLGARLDAGPSRGTPGPDGRFMITGVSPHVGSVQFENIPPGKYVKSIRFGDREIKNAEIDLSGGSSGALNIILGADCGQVDGNVQTASGQPAAVTPITLAPAEEFEGRWDLLKQTVTDESGNFQIKDVAPGEYKVFAWEGDPDDRTQSAEFRKPFESRSASVTIGPKDKASVQLSVITAEDVEKEINKLP